MSVNWSIEHSSQPHTLAERLLARVAVAASFLLAKASPRRIVRVLSAVVGPFRPATYAEASRARSAIVSVSRRCAGQGCLPRSIGSVLYCAMRFRSVPGWRAGVRPVPFAAHAWVEADGQIVDEDAYRDYVPLVCFH